MKTLLSGFCGAVAMAVATVSVMPAEAAPMFVAHTQAAPSDVIQVRDGWRRNRGGHWDGNYGWYNGHRGYRRYQPGFRSYNGFWFPGAAFIAGAVIGNALADSDPYYDEPYYGERYYRRDYSGGSHVDWCYNRYRSYRSWDNSFQPYHGPRQQCYSPYD